MLFVKFELKMISSIEILHKQLGGDQLKTLISRHSHVSDRNFSKEDRKNFLTESWQTSDDHKKVSMAIKVVIHKPFRMDALFLWTS